MTAGQLIAMLEEYPKESVVAFTVKKPHSYRGYYERLAFEFDWQICSVEKMIGTIRSALGRTYTGYKGGEYYMNEDSDVYLAKYGCCGEELGPTIIRLAVTTSEQ